MVEKMLSRLENESISDGITRAVGMLPSDRQKKAALTPRQQVQLSPRKPSRSPIAANPADNPKFDALLVKAQDELKRRDAALGPTHPGTLERLHTLGALLAAQPDRLDEAEGHLERAFRLRSEYLGVSHTKTRQSATALDHVRRIKSGDLPPLSVTLKLAFSSKDPQSPRVQISYG